MQMFRQTVSVHKTSFAVEILAAATFVLLTACTAHAESPHVVFLIGEDEYNTKETLPKFAEAVLKPAGFRCSYIQASEADPNRFDNIKFLDTADLLFVSVRRRTPVTDQMEKIKAFCSSGKPIIGIRTASHAFSLREGKPPEEHSDWPEFDAEVLGGNYHLHYGNKKPDDPKTFIWVDEDQEDHPILKDLKRGEFHTHGWLYKNEPLQPSATQLIRGRVAGLATHEPVAWTNTHEGARVFYTSLGTQTELESEFLQKLLLNAVQWALAGETVSADEAVEPDAAKAELVPAR